MWGESVQRFGKDRGAKEKANDQKYYLAIYKSGQQTPQQESYGFRIQISWEGEQQRENGYLESFHT